MTPIDTLVQNAFRGLVPISGLLVEDVNIEFQMEVSVTESSKDTTSAEASFDWFSRAKVAVQGKVSSSRENTQQTNQTAKYQIQVAAR
jgi:hypothetical protein